MELLSVHSQCHLCCGSDSYGPCAYIWVQRWRWWKRNLQSCCWEKICQVVWRVSAQQWPFQMPSLTSLVHIHCCFRNMYFLICAPVCLCTFLLLFVQKILFLCSCVSVLFICGGCSFCLWVTLEIRAICCRAMCNVAQRNGMAPLCQWLHCGAGPYMAKISRW